MSMDNLNQYNLNQYKGDLISILQGRGINSASSIVKKFCCYIEEYYTVYYSLNQSDEEYRRANLSQGKYMGIKLVLDSITSLDLTDRIIECINLSIRNKSGAG